MTGVVESGVDGEMTDRVDWGAFSGCGRKLSQADLGAFSGHLSRPANAAMPAVTGIPLLSDCGAIRLADGSLMLQTIDVVLPLQIAPGAWGRAVALHCLSDIWAAGGSPLAALGLVEVAQSGSHSANVGEAYGAAIDELHRHGVSLVGGHSLYATVTKMGFAISGTCREQDVRNVSYAVAGEHLFVTKPVGGLSLMSYQLAVKHEVPTAVIDLLVAPSKAAAAVASSVGLRCVSDVSGYGLLGTLFQIADASGTAVDLDIAAIPVVAGARETIGQGGVSPLAERNWLDSWQGRVTPGTSLESGLLLCDPQVNGGLVLSVPPDKVDQLQAEAADVGVSMWRIGQVAVREHDAPIVRIR